MSALSINRCMKRSRLSVRIRAQESGVALVVVLWLVVLLTVIASGHSRNAHIETVLAGRYVETTAARHIADAATQLTIAELLSQGAAERVPADGRLRAIPVGEREAVVSVRRASGLVDLNTANEPILQAVFVAAGARESEAQMLAARVLDWRDQDSFTHFQGAEDDEYRAAGLAWTARDDAFSSVEEVRYVLGMPAELYRSMRPYLTVHSGQAGIELDVAPSFLVEALRSAQIRTSGSRMRPVARGGNGTFHIDVEVLGPGGVFVSSEAVVMIERDADQPFAVLGWRDTSPLLMQAREAERT